MSWVAANNTPHFFCSPPNMPPLCRPEPSPPSELPSNQSNRKMKVLVLVQFAEKESIQPHDPIPGDTFYGEASRLRGGSNGKPIRTPAAPPGLPGEDPRVLPQPPSRCPTPAHPQHCSSAERSRQEREWQVPLANWGPCERSAGTRDGNTAPRHASGPADLSDWEKPPTFRLGTDTEREENWRSETAASKLASEVDRAAAGTGGGDRPKASSSAPACDLSALAGACG